MFRSFSRSKSHTSSELSWMDKGHGCGVSSFQILNTVPYAPYTHYCNLTNPLPLIAVAQVLEALFVPASPVLLPPSIVPVFCSVGIPLLASS